MPLDNAAKGSDVNVDVVSNGLCKKLYTISLHYTYIICAII